MDALHREAVELNSRGSRRSRTPGQRPTSLMAPRSGAGGCTRHPHRCAVRSSNHIAFRGCRIRDDPRLRREESRRAARLGCHHPTTVFSGRVVSSLCPFSPTDLPRAHKHGHSSDPKTRIPTFFSPISPLLTPSNRHFRAPPATKHPPTSTFVRAPVTARPSIEACQFPRA